ncbi:MAG: mersacidin/lichenicidin family type 2 lantibiotic [Acidobacteria bacterium]|nr:mersacidin/lichenicidin family type 2 lantibiotic [Acidobacteriota bacterium]
MKKDILRAWKDEAFRETATNVPDHPAGMQELTAEEAEQVHAAGGWLSRSGCNTKPWICTSNCTAPAVCPTFDCWSSNHTVCDCIYSAVAC